MTMKQKAMNNSLKATLCGLFGYSIFGFSFLFSKVALETSSPMVLVAVRFLVAFIILNLMMISKKNRISFKGKPVFRLLLMGFIQPVVYFICETYGIKMTSASFSGVMIGLVPVAGLILGVIFLKEKCTVFQIFCTVMSVIGVVMTTNIGQGGFSLMGFLLLIGAVLSTSTFTVLSRSVADDFTPFERTYAMTGLGGICFTTLALIETKGQIHSLSGPLSSGKFWLAVLYLSVVSSVIAFLLINYALNYLSVGKTLIFSNFTTVISVLSGILILGDSFTVLQIAGIVIIIISVFGVSYKKEKNGSLSAG